MIEEKFNESWKYWTNSNAFALVWDLPKDAKEITLPHDAMIEKKANPESKNKGNTGYRDGDVYNYVKSFYAPKEYEDQTVILKFEGVYMNAFVYINGELAAKCPFGYSTFYVNMNGFLKYDEENEIRVIARNNAMPNSRWYSGGGIYRDVYLLISNLTYIVPEGVQIETETAEADYAVIKVAAEIKNRYHKNTELILKTIIEDEQGNQVGDDQIPVVLFAEEERTVSQRITIRNPVLWSENTPVLYTCTSKLYMADKVIDESQNKFGIRTLQLDSQKGFRVNKEMVKLRGACIHHDSGLLGAATYDDAQYRQIKILKEAGFNAVRMSHQPMAPAMLRACDELGVYVMDEAFDMWNRCKSDSDYGLFFTEYWEKDITSMVRKNYNHPSVIFYSIGNEIPEIGTSHGAKICHEISSKIKSLDKTRYTLASINGVFAAGDCIHEIMTDTLTDTSLEGRGNKSGDINVNDFMAFMDSHMDEIVIHPAITKRLDLACASTDIAGYNYMAARYKQDGENYPNRVIVGSETYPPEIPRNWELVKKHNHVIGDFTWTGWDYIGEAGVGVPAYEWGEGGFGAKFPCQLAYCGDIDITGIRRPASYFREIVFGLRKKPYISVQPPNHFNEHLIKTPWIISDSISSWTWPSWENKSIVVELYAGGTEVELFCNEKSLGKKPSGEKVGFRTLFETIYEPGILRAVVYDKDEEIGTMNLCTAGKEKYIAAKPEAYTDKELIYIQIEVQDENEILVPCNDVKLDITVRGAGKLIGFGSGNPKPNYNYNEDVTETFYGRALAIIKRSNLKERITVEIGSKGFQDVKLEF